MIEQSVSLASNGVVKVPGYEQLVRFGYTKNRGVYRLSVTASGEWQKLAIRAFWHVPGGADPVSSLVVDGTVDVPASVTAQPGDGCITFEGTDGTRTVTSADLHYRVAVNSGTEDGDAPEPEPNAWQKFVSEVKGDAAAAEQAKTDAQAAAKQAGASADAAATSAENASQSAADSNTSASNAKTSAETAAMHESAAEQHAETAKSFAEQSAGSASEAQNSADTAGESQQAAASSATKADASAKAAQESATQAENSASEANQASQNAEAAADRAEAAQQQTENTSTDALDKISSAKTDALKALDAKQTSATTAVESAQKKALDSVATAQNTAVKAVSDAQDTATQAVQVAQTSAVDSVEKAGAEVLASIPEDYQTTVQKVKELDAQKAETDESISTVKARQNILIGSETGNPISVDDAFSAPLCGLTVYGKSTQDGTPSPDNPVPIVSAGDIGTVTVKVTGKNLLSNTPTIQKSVNGVTFLFENGQIHTNGTANLNYTRCYINLIDDAKYLTAGKEYTFSANSSNNNLCIYALYRPVNGDWEEFLAPTNGSKTVTIPENDGILFRMTVTRQANVDGATAYPQVELGSSATPYEPYHEQLLTLSTPTGLLGIPVTSGGNYTDPTGQQWVCDEVDLERGVRVQKVYKVEVDGENVKFEQTGRYCNLTQRKLPIALYRTAKQIYAISTFCNQVWYFNKDYAFPYLTVTDLADQLNESCKKQLGKIYYALATPIETPLTTDEIAAYKALTTYGPNTVVQASDGAGLKLDYQRDVNLVIKNLEDAIASMT